MQAAMKRFVGLSPQRGYTFGPAFLWRGWPSLEELGRQRMPVILIADYIEQRMIENIDLTRVLGIVVGRGSVIDPVWDTLVDLSRPSIVGATGIFRGVSAKELVVVDGVEGYAFVRPTEAALAYYRERKGTSPPREHPQVQEVLKTMTDRIREGWLRLGRKLPYDLAEQRAVYDVAKRVAEGGFPTPEDDALLAGILFCTDGGANDRS